MLIGSSRNKIDKRIGLHHYALINLFSTFKYYKAMQASPITSKKTNELLDHCVLYFSMKYLVN